MQEITVKELKTKMDEGEQVFILDVREPFEQYQSKIEYDHSTLIPLGDLNKRMDELEDHRDKEIVCLCRSGGRSARACRMLSQQGFDQVVNLKGGINQWAREIDDSLPVY